MRDLVCRLRWAVRCPSYALVRAISGPNSHWNRKVNLNRRIRSLSTLLGSGPGYVRRTLMESRESSILQSVEKTVSGLPNLATFRGGPELYTVIRQHRPTNVIETGVGAGYSSAYILAALNENGTGTLHSIDMPALDAAWSLPSGRPPGFLVPEALRRRWDFHIGYVQEELPVLLDNLGAVDVFFHDSDHSYENMMFEFRLGYRHLGKGGFLVGDDVTLNCAMLDFASEAKRAVHLIYHHGPSSPFGVILKN